MTESIDIAKGDDISSKVYKLGFDPAADESLAKVFSNRFSRTLYLTWRASHIVPEEFANYVLVVSRQFELRSPTDVDTMVGCFFPHSGLHEYWVMSEVMNFVQHHLNELLSGDVEWVVNEGVERLAGL